MTILSWIDEPFLQRDCDLHPDEIADLLADSEAAAGCSCNGTMPGESCFAPDADRFEVIWECYMCGNWELSAEDGEPPECAAGHGDMFNRFAGSDRPMTESELRTWVPY